MNHRIEAMQGVKSEAGAPGNAARRGCKGKPRQKPETSGSALTLNADVYTPQIEPFLKDRGYAFPVIPAHRYVQSVRPFTGEPQSWIVDRSGTIRLQLLGSISGADAVNEAIAGIDQAAQQK